METVAMVVLGVVFVSLIGGFLLAVVDAGPWDKDELREEERPVDFIGRRW